jgi:hypothetical protein
VKETGIQLTLVDAQEWKTGVWHYRRETWLISGGEIDPAWRHTDAERAADWKPTSRFSLYVINGEVDVRLASYGGVVWPIAWTALFQVLRSPGKGMWSEVKITEAGLRHRAAALDAVTTMPMPAITVVPASEGGLS